MFFNFLLSEINKMYIFYDSLYMILNFFYMIFVKFGNIEVIFYVDIQIVWMLNVIFVNKVEKMFILINNMDMVVVIVCYQYLVLVVCIDFDWIK